LRKVRYKDLDFNFRSHPVTGKLIVAKDVDAVKQGLKNLVMTNKFETLFNPYQYCGVRGMLFENITPVTADIMQKQIFFAAQNYSRRVTILNVIIGVQPDNNEIKVTIIFSLENILDPQSVDMFLERVR
jgi:phage baseplate assembly protein W